MARRIRSIERASETPRIDILAHGLDEATAFKLEAAAISLLGRDRLTNLVSGLGSATVGRMSVEQINARYAPEQAEFQEPAMLIRVNRLFRYDMSPIELYDATRGIWRLSPEKARGRLAMAVFDRVIQEVYEVEAWLPAGSTFSTRGRLRTRGRYELVGRVAKEALRSRYRLKSVSDQLSPGNRYPIRYVG